MITEKGYQRRTYQEILDAKIQKAKELFGEDINTSGESFFGKSLMLNAYDQAYVEEVAELIYFSIYPQYATGKSLDNLCAFVNITRNPATTSRYNVKFTGTADTTVPIGFKVATETGVEFYVVDDTLINQDGTCTAVVECTEAGTMGNVNSGDIAVIVNPDANITSVAGISIVTEATEAESDVDLRKRFMLATAGAGSSNRAAIEGALMRVETVTSAIVVADEMAHTIQCYVNGGETKHEDIAKVIFEKKPIGIATVGDEQETVTDEGGHEHTILFSHTPKIAVRIQVQIKTNAQFEGESGIEQIKSNIMKAINGLGIGKSVILSALYSQIYSVTGVEEAYSIKQSTDGGGTYGLDNVEISEYETAICDTVEVERI